MFVTAPPEGIGRVNINCNVGILSYGLQNDRGRVVKNIMLLFFVIVALFGCTDKKRESELSEKIISLEKRLDECENGAEKIHAKIKFAYDKKQYDICKELYTEMEKRHSGSDLFGEVQDIYSSIIIEERKEAEQKKMLAEKKEREANLKLEKQKQEKLAAIKKLKKNYDDVENITWYENPYFVHYNNRNLTSLYIGHQGSTAWLRLKMSYQGDEWIFFKQAYLSYDGNTKEIFFDEYRDKKSDNSGGGVWEWIDVSVSDEVEAFLREFENSKNAKMRLSGKYTRTRTLSLNERQGIKDVLNAYDLLKQGI